MNNSETWPYGLTEVAFYNRDAPMHGTLHVEVDRRGGPRIETILAVKEGRGTETILRCDAYIPDGHPDLKAAKQLLLDICTARFG